MRTPVLFLGALSVAGCGSAAGAGPARPDGGALGDAGASSDASPAAECEKSTLAISASGTVTTPDRSPFNPALAASPSGDAFLAAWIDIPLPGAIWVSVLGPPTAGVASSKATQVASSSSCNPVAAGTDSGFAVAWGNGTDLFLQRVDSRGATVGPSLQVASRSTTACPDSLVAVGGDLVLEWTEGPQVDGGVGQWFEYAERVGTGGVTQPPVLLDSHGAGSASSLAALGGVPYAVFTQLQSPGQSPVSFVSEVQWSSPLAATTLGPGYPLAFMPAGPAQLATLVSSGSAVTLYETGDGGVASAAQVDPNVFAAGADACGRIVGLASAGKSAGTAGATGPLVAETLAGPPSHVPVTADFNEMVMLGAGSTFGLLWVEGQSGIGSSFGPTTLRFATLTWK